MGLRFRKSIKIAPGVKLNVNKKSVGMSIGGKGCTYSLNSSGRRTTTVGISGTGLSYSQTSGAKKSKSTSRSYNSSAYSQRAMIQQQKQEAKLAELESNKLEVDEYENYIDLIRNVHHECENTVQWNSISIAPAPFVKGEIGPAEAEARLNLENFVPTLVEKMFPKKAADRKSKLELALIESKEIDEASYQAWEESTVFANRILSGDIDAYYEAIITSNPFEDLVDFGSGFEFGTDDADTMEIEFMVKSEQVIPEKSKSLTKTGKLSEKNLSKTAYFDITQDYVCSCSIRLARELFALLPIQNVLVHATDQILNTATGNSEEHTILSVMFSRERFNSTNFSKIDASDFVESFEHKMSFKKTTGLQSVERLQK